MARLASGAFSLKLQITTAVGLPRTITSGTRKVTDSLSLAAT
jgi:hypothetical protein